MELAISTEITAPPGKYLLTGAGGFIGSALGQELARGGAELVLLYHKSEPALDAVRFALDLSVDEPPEECFAGVDVIYHCAGIAHQAAGPADYEALNYQATLKLAEAALRAGVRCFVFLSSVQAGPEADPYGYWKWRAEQALRERFEDSAMTVVVVRPALVYGVGAGANLALLCTAVRSGLPRPPAGERRSLVSLTDLCECLLSIPGAGLGGYHCITVTDGQPYTTARLYDAIRVALGRRPGRQWLPAAVWQWGCACLDLVRGVRGRQGSYQKLFGGAWYEDSAPKDLLGWTPRLQFEDLAADMMKRY